MELRDYLHFKKIKVSTFSKEIGIHANYLRLISNTRKEPSLELAVKIELYTGGQVTIKDLKPSYEGPWK